MKQAFLLLSVFTLLFNNVEAQNKIDNNLSEQILLTINGVEVTAGEFEGVYENNINLVQDPEQKKIDSYFPLFVAYKAKLMQAHDLGLDTAKEYTAELAKYRKDLVMPYFKDPVEEEKLVKEAWERSKEELNTSHILLMVSQGANPKDTLKAYNRLLSIRKQITSGSIKFDAAAFKYSEDPSAKNNRGNLNWMSVFYMVYPFETGAYNTKVGEVSMPVRTSYGYHLIKVNDKRASKGKIQIAHIIKLSKKGVNADSLSVVNKTSIDSAYVELQNGKKFADVARSTSDDVRSAMNGGVLPPFGAGKLVPEMEAQAFALKEGEYSKPFETRYGWHIVKLVKKFPVPSFEEAKEEMRTSMLKDKRSKYIDKSVVNSLKDRYKVTVSNKNFTEVERLVDADFLLSAKKDTKEFKTNKSVLKIENKEYKGDDYYAFLKSKSSAYKKFSVEYFVASARALYIEAKLLEYHDENLEGEYPEFHAVMTNYREGILIFNLMNYKVWDKAKDDTLGLANFYDANKTNYMWTERVDIVKAKCFKEDKAKKVRKYLKRKKTQEYIENKLNKGAEVNVIIQNGKLTKDSNKLPENFEWKKGVSDIYKVEKNNFVVIYVNEIVKPEVKTLKEAKGSVVSDYQNYLEKEWKQELEKNYKVNLNKDVYNKIKQKYNQ